MLKLIEGRHASLFPKEIDAMFRNRAQTFSQRLDWDVMVIDGYERDVFDDVNPLYLISVDPVSGEYWGSLRLLRTTGPNMLRDVFPFLLGEGQFIESDTIWEVSRMCTVSPEVQLRHGRSGLNIALGELIAGIAEVSSIAGLTQIVAVFDARIYRVLKMAGCNPRMVGRPQKIGSTTSYVAVFESTEAALQSIRETLGIQGSVLAPAKYEHAFVHINYASVAGSHNSFR